MRLIPAQYVKPFLKGHKNDYRDAEAIAEAVQRPTMHFVRIKTLEIVDVVRDDMFTVLFQKNGIRYAVVTLPQHENWLTDILTTRHFTD